jgi:hypothetical protein
MTDLSSLSMHEAALCTTDAPVFSSETPAQREPSSEKLMQAASRGDSSVELRHPPRSTVPRHFHASTSAANDGLVLLIDARSCSVHYRRTGVFLGDPCSTGASVVHRAASCIDKEDKSVICSRCRRQADSQYLGDPCSTSFLGSHLIVASTHSVAVWDTVDDVVKMGRRRS